MEPGLVVPPEQVIDAGQFQAHPRQVRPDGQRRLEAPGGVAEPTEPDFRAAEQEQALGVLVGIGRPRLLQKRARVAKTAGFEEKPAELHVGKPVREAGGLAERGRGEQQRCHDRGRESA